MIQIKKYSPTSHKVKAVIYGASGAGKTSFAGGAEKAIFASAEGGLLSIASKNPNYVEIKSLQDLNDLLAFLTKGGHGYETVIIDSITEINDIIKTEIEKRTGKPMQLQDWGNLQKKIVAILRGYRDLDMNVLFIAQEKEGAKDENGASQKIVPNLNGDMAERIAYFMDIVGYILVEKTGAHKVITASSPRYLTKDRTGLVSNDEEPNFQVWIDKVREMKTDSTEEVVKDIETTTDEPVKKINILVTTLETRIKTLKTPEEVANAKAGIENHPKLTFQEKTDLLAKLPVFAPKVEEGALPETEIAKMVEETKVEETVQPEVKAEEVQPEVK
jgi:hypothetical protein